MAVKLGAMLVVQKGRLMAEKLAAWKDAKTVDQLDT